MDRPASASRTRLDRRARGCYCGCFLVLSSLGFGCVIPIGDDVPSDGGVTGEGASNADVANTSDVTLPSGSWTNVTANLANMDSECGNMTSLFAKPDEDLLIAGIALKGLWAISGDTWVALGTGAGSATITNRPTSLVYDPQDSMRYWESGIYGQSGGVYETRDHGNTFAQLGNVLHSDLVAVDFSDPARKTLVSGGHEQVRTLNRSTDNGATWSNVAAGLPADGSCTLPLVIDAQTHLVGCTGYGGGPSGVYRTNDGATTWTLVTPSGGASAPLRASDSSIYWASPNGKGITRSVDDGQHWTDVVGSGVVTSAHLVELPNGWLATLGPQYIMVSVDHGATWSPASQSLPYADAVGVVYSSQRKAFYIWHFTCPVASGPVPVPSDAIMRFNFDYQK